MTIGIWGDSITYGEGDTEALGWVGRFRKSLATKDDSNVYNFGVCGDTTEELIKRFEIEAESIQPDMIIFAIGINDSKYPKGDAENFVPINTFRQNMQMLLTWAKRYSASVYVIGATRVDDEFARSPRSRFVNVDIQRYNGVLRECAQFEQSTFVDTFDVLNPAKDLIDGLHPNAAGYEKLFQAISPTLIK